MAGFSLSKVRAFIRGFEDSRFFIGLDVHKRSFHVAIRRSDGETDTWVAPASSQCLVDQIHRLDIRVGCLAYEAGPTGFSLARTLENAGYNVVVAAPSRIPRPSTSSAKTDRLDCIKLAEYAAKGMLKTIAIPSEQDEADRSLARRRHQLVDEVRRVKNRIKAFLLYLGIEEPAELRLWTRGSIDALNELDLQQASRWTLESMLIELSCLEGNLATVNKQLGELSGNQRHKGIVDCLRTVPGVGPVVASTFRFELFKPERFDRAREVAGYLGLAPTVRQSGEGKSRGQLRPAGQERLRSLLVEAAWSWRAKDPWAGRTYRKLLSRCGIAQKAIVALARKLAIILWRLCLEERPYYVKPIEA